MCRPVTGRDGQDQMSWMEMEVTRRRQVDECGKFMNVFINSSYFNSTYWHKLFKLCF